jgi:hypothetical protein
MHMAAQMARHQMFSLEDRCISHISYECGSMLIGLYCQLSVPSADRDSWPISFQATGLKSSARADVLPCREDCWVCSYSRGPGSTWLTPFSGQASGYFDVATPSIPPVELLLLALSDLSRAEIVRKLAPSTPHKRRSSSIPCLALIAAFPSTDW